MTDSSSHDDGATAEGETPRGAPAPATMDGRETDGGKGETPPEARDADEEKYDDRYGEAREGGGANPDQHRDDEAYD